jgi:formate dehydrogenase
VKGNPEWAKKDQEGFLKVHADDAASYHLEDLDAVRLTSMGGAIDILVTITNEVTVGVISMPHGHGMNYGDNRDFKQVGAMPNQLTSASYCDQLAKTPFHKNVRVQLEKLNESVMM